MKNYFAASEFTPTPWNTASDKAQFANQLVDFMRTGYRFTKFHNAFYQKLSNCFGHIAHYDKTGFFATWFATEYSQREFVQKIMDYPGIGDPAFCYSDVEKAVRKHVRLSFALSSCCL